MLDAQAPGEAADAVGTACWSDMRKRGEERGSEAWREEGRGEVNGVAE